MPIYRAALTLAILPLAAWSQTPVISSVVSAASYATGEYTDVTITTPIRILGLGSIASIFGTNLAATTAEAASVPLPWQLAGTAVSVYGVAAPLFYVSPTQINFQWPTGVGDPPGASSAQGVVVATGAGLSDVYTAVGGGDYALGIFTQNASGCGPGAVLNVNPDGSVSLNSPANSAQPGSYISIYGSGLGGVYDIRRSPPPDGAPTPLSPLAPAEDPPGALFDFVMSDYEGRGPYSWEGMAPGLVGVAQFNMQIPAPVRQGCHVPLQLLRDISGITAPVTVSIASGGGQCADPPSQGDGLIAWQKTITASATNTVTESDTLTVSLQASPGRQVPPPLPYAQAYVPGATFAGAWTYFGPACPIPGYRSLGAGTVTVQGPGFGPVQAVSAPLQGGTVIATAPLPTGGFTPIPPVQSGQASGLTVYRATLPNGSIRPGSFTVSASGGADVGAFQSTVRIGSPIQIAQPLAGQTLPTSAGGLTLTWTGGDPDAWVTFRLVGNAGYVESYPMEYFVRASAGAITIPEPYDAYGTGLEMVIEVVPDPSIAPSFSASGLSLGGQHSWKYTYVYEGLTVGPQSTP